MTKEDFDYYMELAREVASGQSDGIGLTRMGAHLQYVLEELRKLDIENHRLRGALGRLVEPIT